MLTRDELLSLADFIERERDRLEDEDGVEPVQDHHAAVVWKILTNMIFPGTNYEIVLD